MLGKAQLSRHLPYRGRDDRLNRRDALAACGATPSAGGSDNLVHFIALAALTFPLARAGRFGLMLVCISASAFGAIIEFIQRTFDRSTGLKDWIADTLGVLIGIGLGLLYPRIRQRRA